MTFRAIAAGLFLALATVQPAFALCEGRDMLPELRAADPEAFAAARAAADAVPNGQGLFWQVSRPGTAPSYLYGTFHDEEAVAGVPDAAWAALDAADNAAFEVTLAESAALEQRMIEDFFSFAIDIDLPPLLDALTEDERARLEAAMNARGMPVDFADQMRTFMLFALLGSTACELRNADAEGPSLDDVMETRAMAAGIPVHGLETAEEALGADAHLDRVRVAKGMIPSSEEMAREDDIKATAMALYQRGEVAMIVEFGILATERFRPEIDARAEMDYVMAPLAGGRNRMWMPRLLPLLEQGNAFVAVGALHLPGEDGLIELLRAEGWTVTRLD